MGLSKYKLGNLIVQSEERNDSLFDNKSVVGLSTQKTLIQTKANLDGVSLTSYKLFPPKAFAYVPDTSRRGDKISLAFNSDADTYIVSSISIVFLIKKSDILLPDYLFMYFNRSEFDRYARFNSWGSARETFDWDRFCNIELSLPPIDIQQKYVDIYKALVANQKAYESGAEDLKLVCDAYIEDLRRKLPCEKIGKYIRACDERNTDLSVTLAQGVTVNMEFENPKRIAEDTNATRIVRRGQFAYNKVMKSNRTKLPIALRTGDDCIVSGSYQVFEINDPKTLLPEYLMIWLMRPETQRFAGYRSWGSTRDVFTFDDMCDVKIPIPDIKIQRAIADVYRAYNKRKELAEKLKEQIKNICPILIRGAIEEGENARIK